MYRAELTILINAKWNSKQKAFSEVSYLNNDEIHSTPSIGTRYHVITTECKSKDQDSTRSLESWFVACQII